MSPEIRDLIRRMSLANPLWGAPRIHGELLKLGIEVSQATVGRYLPWRPKVPSPTWRSFLHNHLTDIAAIDMFVVATATFRLLYALIILGHDRRKSSMSSAFAAVKTVTLAVKNMYCASCPHTVKASLLAVPGVTTVIVSVADLTAQVTFDDSKADVQALVKATTNAGYPSEPKS